MDFIPADRISILVLFCLSTFLFHFYRKLPGTSTISVNGRCQIIFFRSCFFDCIQENLFQLFGINFICAMYHYFMNAGKHKIQIRLQKLCFCQYKSKKNLLLIRKKHHCFHPVMLLRTILFRLCFFFFVENVIHLPAYLHTTWFINKDFLNNL